MVPELLTGDEDSVYGDSGCLGAEKREDAVLFNVNGQGKRIRYKINRRLSQSKHADNRSRGQIKRREKEKSPYAKVEHVFGVVKASFDTGKLGTEVCETDCQIEYPVRAGESDSG